MLEKILESPLDCKIKPVNSKGNQPWLFIGRTDAEAVAPKSQLTGKDPDSGKDWRQEEKGATEDGTIDSMDMSFNKFQEVVKDREALHAAVHRVAVGHNWTTEQQMTEKENKV